MGAIGDAFKKLGVSGPMASDGPDVEDPDSDMSAEPDDDGDELSKVNDKAELAATKSLLKAIGGGKPEAVRDALKSFMSACGMSGSDY